MSDDSEPLNLADRRELFVDDHLIDRFAGGARLMLHHPRREEVVFEHDTPWEGNISGYATVLRETDGQYRMYYRGWHADTRSPRADTPLHEAVICLALSDDGLHWTRPNLGLIAWDGSTDNNLIWTGPGSEAFVPMLDTNPDAAPEARYKSTGLNKDAPGERLLFALQSPDGIHWQRMRDEPILDFDSVTSRAFDSMNVPFWDAVRGEYRIYFRDWIDDRIREIKTATSRDFLNWTEPVFIGYEPDVQRSELYTNGVQPYHRAPHLFTGFPARYMHQRAEMLEPLFMTSRDGWTFHRWEDALIRPGRNADKWHNRSNYAWLGMIETASPLPGDDAELSIYTNESYFKGEASRIRRYSYRLDGFVSLHAGAEAGEVLTKPIKFTGHALRLNYSTAVAGHVRVELQHPDGTPIAGFTLDDMTPVYGDALDQPFAWNDQPDLSHLAGQPVRLRFELKDADVYAMRFDNE